MRRFFRVLARILVGIALLLVPVFAYNAQFARPGALRAAIAQRAPRAWPDLLARSA